MDEINKQLFLVGETLDHKNNSWLFQGVYSTEEIAITKCVKDNFFIARIEVDFDEPIEIREFDYVYYPKLEDKPLIKEGECIEKPVFPSDRKDYTKW
jgi:hypothetical protein